MGVPKKKKSGRTRLYFPAASLEYVPTGSTLLDCALNGGYPLGRVVNIVGDKSTGKTLLAMEAIANFVAQFGGSGYFVDAEAAFDANYAESLGIPLDNITLKTECCTIEDWYSDFNDVLHDHEQSGKPAIYVLDSLDALSDESEIKRDLRDASYGAEKAKKLSELFRRLVRRIENTKVCLIVISQVRDKIGVVFGKKTTRSGGRALDFYASQIIYLSHLKRLEVQRKSEKRVKGIQIKALIEKNKVGLPFRSCEFPILFNYGIDDVVSCKSWIDGVEKGRVTDRDSAAVIKNAAKDLWYEIEEQFREKRGPKYGTASHEDSADSTEEAEDTE